MDARHLLARHGKHAKGVVGAQVVFGGEGEFGQIGQRSQIMRVDTGSIKRLFVVRHLVVGVLQRLLQASQLQRLQLVLAGAFNRL